MNKRNLKFLTTLVSVGVVSTFVGCQVHKPVPVEHVNPLQQGSVFHRPLNPVPVSVPVRAPRQANQQSASWSPIVVEPIVSAPVHSAAQEPTQPLNRYEFKPHPGKIKSDNSSRYTKPVSVPSRAASGSHIVRRGESLYGIARQYGMSTQRIASLNNLRHPFEIYPNQKLRVSGKAQVGYVKPAPVAKKPKPVKAASIKWAWPATGDLIGPFKAGVSNGIEIGGDPGRTIRASADGTVLYSGNEVTGYGELIIVDHGNGFMSTYAHNRKLLVKQGAQVARGQKIAEMGSSESERTKLHFEIRKGEKPVNPLAYLPAR